MWAFLIEICLSLCEIFNFLSSRANFNQTGHKVSFGDVGFKVVKVNDQTPNNLKIVNMGGLFLKSFSQESLDQKSHNKEGSLYNEKIKFVQKHDPRS